MASRLKFKDIVEKINNKWKGKFTVLEDINTFEYKNVHQHISVRCNDCGKIYKDDDKKRINDLLHGHGCNRCAGTERHTNAEWKLIVETVTKGEYSLISDHYRTRDICTFKHNDPNCKNKENDGKFEKKLHNFITLYQRCPFCQESFMGIKDSKGMILIKEYLDENGIEYETEYKFDGCRSESTNRLLPFDIYIESMNTLIEFDGIHHYQPVEVFGGQEEFEKRVKNDKTKNEFAKKREINLIRISYKEINNIKSILKEKFGR